MRYAPRIDAADAPAQPSGLYEPYRVQAITILEALPHSYARASANRVRELSMWDTGKGLKGERSGLPLGQSRGPHDLDEFAT